MKFIHIADIHLGAVPDSNMPWGKEREKEIWNSFHNIITVCNEEKVELLLIAGDLFHRQPLMRELKEIDYYFSKLETAQVIIIAGNHDYIGARSNYDGFEWGERVHMLLSDTMDTIYYPQLDTEVSGFSYHTRDILMPLYDNIVAPANDHIHILLAHGGDEKDIPINKRRLQDAGFDYVALGHIHKPDIISQRMAYVGSLEPLDKNETGERGYILGEITVKEGYKETQTQITFVPSSVRQYKKLALTVNQETTNRALLDQAAGVISTHGEKHIYCFNIQGVRDVDINFDMGAIAELGNVIEVLDQSVPDYDFDALSRENSDNLIGLFIQNIRANTEQDEIAKKALYYGIEALLKLV